MIAPATRWCAEIGGRWIDREGRIVRNPIVFETADGAIAAIVASGVPMARLIPASGVKAPAGKPAPLMRAAVALEVLEHAPGTSPEPEKEETPCAS